MNSIKMTIDQFEDIKVRLNSLIQDLEAFMENYYFASEKKQENFEHEIEKKYINIINTLLSYNLSEIPFDAWKDFEIVIEIPEPIDFSQTKANLDFNIFKLNQKGIFKNCNVKNIEALGEMLNENSFDQSVIDNHQHLFLSKTFTQDFKKKYYEYSLALDDLVTLSAGEIKEFEQKNGYERLKSKYRNTFLKEVLGLNKIIELYKYSKEDYEEINKFFNRSLKIKYDRGIDKYLPTFIDKIKNNEDISQIKTTYYEYLRNSIINSKVPILIGDYPQDFINANKDLFLIDTDLPEYVRIKYFEKNLSIKDILEYSEKFTTIPLDNFTNYYNFTNYSRKLGKGNFQKILVKYKNLFQNLDNIEYFLDHLFEYLIPKENYEQTFISTVKNFYVDLIISDAIEENNTFEYLKQKLSEFDVKIIKKIETEEDFKNLTSNTVVADKKQAKVLRFLGIENLLRFDKETGLFSKAPRFTDKVDILNMLADSLALCRSYQGTLSFQIYNNAYKPANNYEEFKQNIVLILETLRKSGSLTYQTYHHLEGAFRKEYANLFISKDAPREFSQAFYQNKITPKFLFQNKEIIPYLLDKNPEEIIRGNFNVNAYPSYETNAISQEINFIKMYSTRFGNEALLNLLAQYGEVCDDLSKGTFITTAIKEEIDKQFREAIYKRIFSSKHLSYKELAFPLEYGGVPEFVDEYPAIFIKSSDIQIENKNEKYDIVSKFYNRTLTFADIRKYPQLIDVLKDKNLKFIFEKEISTKKHWSTYGVHLTDVIGNENFLRLCSIYGRYLPDTFVSEYDAKKYASKTEESFKDLCKVMENYIAHNCFYLGYDYHPDDAPEFLKNEYPNLFLSKDAPEELVSAFYFSGNIPLSFEILKEHKDWLPYLEGKSVVTALLKGSTNVESCRKYFELFDEKALKFGIRRTETVKTMINDNQVDLMYHWYNRTGQRFIPDFIVMQNFGYDEENISKFLSSAQNWSKLMRIEEYAQRAESRDAMLKLAYSFGAFDNDKAGFHKLVNLLTDIPREISSEYNDIIEFIDSYYIERDLEEALTKEGFTINSDLTILNQLYKKNPDGSRTLTINTQSYPHSTKVLRNYLATYSESIVLNHNKVHQLFGGFTLKYDSDFREFLCANINTILKNPEYISYIAQIQKQFDAIKTTYSNKILTLDLAISYIQDNRYKNIEAGNEKVAAVSAIAGYSQEDFNILQQIYNYGKQRTFSSIPRIENKTNDYSYEMLRLDDPLAMVIGNLSDCCQELGDMAEMCMEHSMVSKHGRIFVIKDKEGNVVSQSWVWRNQDVICFDNIEIPHKAFARYDKISPDETRKNFSDIIYEIYKKAAKELLEEDEKVYRQLLENGEISQEDYDSLRLGKVTVGLGYNDIATSIRDYSIQDNEPLSQPLPFVPPVKLARGLYTNDSKTQYVLAKRNDRIKPRGEALTIHSDDFIEYTDENFDKKLQLTLQKLELISGERNILNTEIYEYQDQKKPVTIIAENYFLYPQNTRIIMNPNFAIIYEINANTIKLADLLYNFEAENKTLNIKEPVLIQIRKALLQIGKNKNIDISELSDTKREVYNDALGEEIKSTVNKERGIKHGQ